MEDCELDDTQPANLVIAGILWASTLLEAHNEDARLAAREISNQLVTLTEAVRDVERTTQCLVYAVEEQGLSKQKGDDA